jgi:two-component system chemotaxis response regulator CheB
MSPILSPVALVAIGCSAGGPPALQEVLPVLPRDLPATVVVAQHMPERFTALLAERLARLCPLPVIEIADGERVQGRRICIAPGGRQTILDRGANGVVFRVRPRGTGERYAPSADLLMASVAMVYGRRAVGVLMTGMGDDGVSGLRAIKSRRGRTLVESEETAVVFGMPREAIRAGVADQILPRSALAPEIRRLCGA